MNFLTYPHVKKRLRELNAGRDVSLLQQRYRHLAPGAAKQRMRWLYARALEEQSAAEEESITVCANQRRVVEPIYVRGAFRQVVRGGIYQPFTAFKCAECQKVWEEQSAQTTNEESLSHTQKMYSIHKTYKRRVAFLIAPYCANIHAVLSNAEAIGFSSEEVGHKIVTILSSPPDWI